MKIKPITYTKPFLDPFRQEVVQSTWDPVKKEMAEFTRYDSVYNAARERQTNAFHLEAKAYAPKVTPKNDIFPQQHEIYNCTTCLFAEDELPINKMNVTKYKVKCTANKQWNEGDRFGDIGCLSWDPKISRPRKGYTSGIDI